MRVAIFTASRGEAIGRTSPPAARACSSERGSRLGDISGHAQHVSERNEDDILAQRQLDRGVNVFLGTHANRTSGAGNELDIAGQRAAQARH